MAKTEITLTFEEEKLDALEFCLRKENSMSSLSPARSGSIWTARPR